MSGVRDAMNAALDSLVGVPCERTLAANSLKFRFDCLPGEKGRAYIWIDPPWRMTFANRLVTGSYDCPDSDRITEEEPERVVWESWWALFDPLNRTAVTSFVIGTEFPDLLLTFETGHRVETFGNSANGYWWYYRDLVTRDVFEAGAAGIIHDVARS